MPDIENAITIDVVTKEWEGILPKRCSQVALQWLNAEGEWEPSVSRLLARDRADVVERIEKLVRTGPLKFKKYRLVPYAYDNETTNNDSTTEGSMKKTTKKAAKFAKKENVELVFDRFRVDKIGGKFLQLLMDGKARSAEVISKHIHAPTAGHLAFFSKWGKESGKYRLEKTADGLWQMIVKKAAASSTPKKANGVSMKAKAVKVSKKKAASAAPPPPVVEKTGVLVD